MQRQWRCRIPKILAACCRNPLLLKELEKYFESKVEIPLMRRGKSQRIETLINEEVLLLAKYLRNERKDWIPRISR